MRAFTLLVAAVAAFTLSMPAAAAAPATAPGDPWACWFPPSPGSGWSISTHRHPTCERCEAAGEAGVARGDWDAFRCAFVPIGLDGDYFIFLPTEPGSGPSPGRQGTHVRGPDHQAEQQHRDTHGHDRRRR